MLDTKTILDRFGAAFLVKQPHYNKDLESLKSYFHGSVSVVETSHIASLGSGTKKEPLNLSQLHFGVQMPFDFDLGLQTSLKTGATDIQQFGGFVRWRFSQYGPIVISTVLHGSGVNFENQMGVNLFGAVVGAEIQVGYFNLYAATGPLKVTSSFQPLLFGAVPATTFNLSRQYSHQVFRLSVEFENWNMTGQTDWVKDFHSSLMVGRSF
jgi:hypothetical protein